MSLAHSYLFLTTPLLKAIVVEIKNSNAREVLPSNTQLSAMSCDRTKILPSREQQKSSSYYRSWVLP
jgi:hypothetical protein